MLRRHQYLFLAIIGLFLIIFVFFIQTGFKAPDKDNKPVFGLNLSKPYAESLGLNWGEVYLAALEDLQVKYFRLPSYWEGIEIAPGNYNFSDLDWQIWEAEQHQAKIILVLGERQPRWPECHIPDWAKSLSRQEQQLHILEFISATVEHYKNSPAIEFWQVENEPLLNSFGECASADIDFLKDEVELVQRLDPTREVIITESGELSTWLRSTNYSDILGISIYRLVWNQYLGYLNYPLTPGHYARKYDFIKYKSVRFFITELQTEPWAPSGMANLAISDQLKQVNAQELKNRAEFAREIGSERVYFWGAEWWWWLSKQGDASLWEASKPYFID